MDQSGQNLSGGDEGPFVKGCKHRQASSPLFPPGLARLNSFRSAVKLHARGLNGFQSSGDSQIGSDCSASSSGGRHGWAVGNAERIWNFVSCNKSSRSAVLRTCRYLQQLCVEGSASTTLIIQVKETGAQRG